ncbi:MAG: hypothetical protein AAGE94_17175 [Acidobacteriota bacterium]
MPTRPSDPLRDGLLLAVLAAAAIAHFVALRDYHFEDAFITFRYAANLAAGEGFAFNPGDRVFGTSTPLYALLLALVAWLGADPAVVGEFLFCVALPLAGGIGAWILRRADRPWAGVAFALAAAWAAGGVLRFHGMETALYVALLLATIAAAFADRPWWTGLFAGLLCLTRYDGVVPVAVLYLDLWLRRAHAEAPEPRSWSVPLIVRSLPWREIAGVSALLGGWLLFAWLYFGDPMPHTLGAKAGSTVSTTDYAMRAARGQFLDVSSPIERRFGEVVPVSGRNALTGLLAVAALLGAPALLRRSPRWWTLPAIAFLLLLGYAVIGPPAGHRWYHVPGLYCGLLFAVAASAELGRRLPRRLVVGVSIAALLTSLIAIPVTADREARFLDRGAARRLHTYDRFAEWVLHHDLSEQVLLTREPGYIAYRTGLTAIDAVGLVTEGIYYHGSAERRSSWDELIERFDPGLAVLHSHTGEVEGAFIGRFAPVVLGPPERMLLMARPALAARAETLSDAWRAGHWLGTPSEPSTTDDPAEVEAPETIRLAGGWAATRVLGNRKGRGSAWTEPFRLDADELHIRTRGDGDVAIQLVVDGLPVLQLDAAKIGPELAWHAIPTYPWRHRQAEIRLTDTDPEGSIQVDGIRWRDYPIRQRFDDFEDGWGERWQTTWSDTPTPTEALLADRGVLPAVLGRYSASSLGRDGDQTLTSRSFTIEHDRLVLVFGDFGDARSTISLFVDGERAVQVAGRDTGRLGFLKWDLTPYRGREGVLVIRDGDPDPDRGLTVDEIVLVSNQPPSSDDAEDDDTEDTAP